MKRTFSHYLVRSSEVEDNIRFIKKVFEELKTLNPEGIDYTVYQMGEGVFIHVAGFADDKAHQKFLDLSSVRDFQVSVKTRLKEDVIINEVEEIGTYTR